MNFIHFLVKVKDFAVFSDFHLHSVFEVYSNFRYSPYDFI